MRKLSRNNACYGKTRKQTDCDGQAGYTIHILDDLIDKIVRDIFAKMKAVPKSEVIQSKYTDELELRKAKLIMLRTEYAKSLENLNILKSEVVKAIKGESSFSPEVLSGIISDSEKECDRLLNLCQNAEREVNENESILKDLSTTYDELFHGRKFMIGRNLQGRK